MRGQETHDASLPGDDTDEKNNKKHEIRPVNTVCQRSSNRLYFISLKEQGMEN